MTSLQDQQIIKINRKIYFQHKLYLSLFPSTMEQEDGKETDVNSSHMRVYAAILFFFFFPCSLLLKSDKISYEGVYSPNNQSWRWTSTETLSIWCFKQSFSYILICWSFINKVNFALGVGNKWHLLIVVLFLRKSIVKSLFMFQKTVNMNLFTYLFFFFRESMYFDTMDRSTQARCPIRKNFSSLYTPHILWILQGLHFSAIKKLMTNFCSSLEHSLWFAAILNSLKTKIFARLKWFLR